MIFSALAANTTITLNQEEQLFFVLSRQVDVLQVQRLKKKEQGIYPLLKIKASGSYESMMEYIEKIYEQGYRLCPSSTFRAKDQKIHFQLYVCSISPTLS